MEVQNGSAAFDPSVPLRGVVLCCTSIPPDTRTALAKQAEQMGAQHKYDLTSEVTHLIVGEYDTPKYRYVAKERPDVKVLTVSWIEAIRDMWMADQHMDLEALESEHTLPTLATLNVCMTGFDDSAERSNIINLICSNGGAYHGDLTKSITHLIASRPEGKKYKFAKEWKIRLVSAEWLYDSVQRGMILDENLYHPETSPEERGKGAWVRRSVTHPLGKRSREEGIVEDGTRKLRRTLSKKLTSQNEVVWGDIVGGSSTLLNNNANMGQLPGEEPTSKQTIPDRPNSGPETNFQASILKSAKRGTFSQCRFFIHGFESKKAQTLARHVVSHDGDVRANSDELVVSPPIKSYIIVPHNFVTTDLPSISKTVPVVTEWWVERCLEAKECLEHSATNFDLPFSQTAIDNFDKLTVATTGFTGFHLLHLSKLVTLMGAKYEEFFSEKSSVLICNATQQVRIEKLQRAKEWRVPVVSIDWLLESIRLGLKQPYKPYLLRPKERDMIASVSKQPSQLTVKKETNYDGFETLGTLPLSKSATSKAGSRPTKVVSRDTTAFDDDDEPTEAVGGFLIPKNTTSRPVSPPPLLSMDHTTAPTIEPLAEISPNSPRKSPISQPRPSVTASSADTQEISSAITSLLAKSKNLPNSGTTVDSNETAAQPTARKPSRILGRAPSNISAVSRASSVDSTASGGQAVHWPAGKRKPLSKVDSLGATVGGLLEEVEKAETQPPMSQQLLYEDEEGEKYKAQVIARMAGKKPERIERARVATVGSLNDSRARSLRTRDRGAGMR